MIFQHLSLDSVAASGAVAVLADLLNGPKYANARYAPTIAPRRPSSLAGQSVYGEVEDEILVDVLGETPAEAAANVETLLGILGQAQEWWEGDATDAIQVRAQAQGPGTPVAATIYGPTPGTPPAAIQVDEATQAPGARYIVRDVSLRFVRRGRWLATRESVAGTADTGNPTIGTIVWPTDQGRVRAPLGIEVDTNAGALTGTTNLLFTADEITAWQFYDLSVFSGSAEYTVVADANNRPYHGANLLRLTPAAANTPYVAADPIGFGVPPSRLIGFWLCARATAPSTANWTITLSVLRQTLAGASTITLPPLVIPSSGDALYYPLGILATNGNTLTSATVLTLSIEADTVAGTQRFDLSHIIAFALDASGANVLQTSLDFDLNGMAALPAEILNAGRSGVVQSLANPDFTDASIPQTYAGDLDLSTAGATAYAVYAGTQGSAFTVGAVGSPIKADFTYTGYRRRSRLTP